MNTLPIASLPRSVKRRRPLPVRTTPPGNSGDAGAFCGCVWACRCFAVRFRFLRLSCSEIRSRGFLRRMLRSFRAQACGFCASCSLSRCAICMKYRRAFCAAAGMRCIRRSARWLDVRISHRLDLHSLPGKTDPPDALPCVSSFMGSDDCADCARASGAASFCARQRASAYNGAVSPRLTSGAGHVKKQKTDLLKPQQIHFLRLYFFFALFQLRNSITTNGTPR